MSESLYQSKQYENSLTEVDHLNRFRNPDGSQNPFAVDGVYKNLVPATKEAGILHAVSTTYQEFREGTYWWLDQTPENVASSGYNFHEAPAAIARVDVEMDEARSTKELRPGFIKVFLSPRMSRKDAPYEVAKREHLSDDDMVRIHIVDMGPDGEPLGKYMQSLLVRHVPLSAWVDMLRDPNNIFGKAIEVEDPESALSVMKVHNELELPESALPEAVVSLVEAVLPYITDKELYRLVEQQLVLFRDDQESLHAKAENIASRWLSFEVALSDSLYDGYATEEIQDFVRSLAFEWNDEMAAEIMQNTNNYGRIRMDRSLAAKLEISRQNTLWVSAAVITGNERVLEQLTPEAAQQIYVNEMFIQTMMNEGASSREVQQVESQSNKAIAKENVTAGGGCPGSGNGLFGSSSNPKGPTGEGSKKCPEVKNGQIVKCPSCKETVKAIVPDKKTIFCSNASCKQAAPHLKGKQQTQEVAKPITPPKVVRQTGEMALAGAQ